jgi:hypothetical protein
MKEAIADEGDTQLARWSRRSKDRPSDLGVNGHGEIVQSLKRWWYRTGDPQ